MSKSKHVRRCAARKWPSAWMTCTQNATHNGDNNAERILISCQISYHRHDDIYIQIACESVGDGSSDPIFGRENVSIKLYSRYAWITPTNWSKTIFYLNNNNSISASSLSHQRTKSNPSAFIECMNVKHTEPFGLCEAEYTQRTQPRQIFIDVDNSTSVAARKRWKWRKSVSRPRRRSRARRKMSFAHQPNTEQLRICCKTCRGIRVHGRWCQRRHRQWPSNTISHLTNDNTEHGIGTIVCLCALVQLHRKAKLYARNELGSM